MNKSRKMYYSTIVLTAIIVMVNNVFDLTTLVNSQGGSNWPDVAQVLAMITLGFAIARSSSIAIIKNKITLVVLAYLILVGVEIALAAFYHDQSLKDGIIAAREQYFYLYFLLFLLLLDDTRKLYQLLNTLTVVALIVFACAIVNYGGIQLFHTTKAEDYDMIRSGIRRAYIPGFRLVSMVFIWQFARLLSVKRSERMVPAMFVVLLFGEHIFRQSRMPLISIMLAAMFMMFVTKRYGVMVKGGVFLLAAALIAGVFMKNNIITDQFTSAVDEVANSQVDAKTGSWNNRLKQIVFAWDEFKEHPWLGSGSVALRVSAFENSTNAAASDVAALAYKADLGYTKVLKAYGVAGLYWLVMFFWVLISLSKKSVKSYKKTREPLLLFAPTYVIYVIFSMVTLNHIMFATATVLILIVSVILVRNERNMFLDSTGNSSPVGGEQLPDNSVVKEQGRILRYRSR